MKKLFVILLFAGLFACSEEATGPESEKPFEFNPEDYLINVTIGNEWTYNSAANPDFKEYPFGDFHPLLFPASIRAKAKVIIKEKYIVYEPEIDSCYWGTGHGDYEIGVIVQENQLRFGYPFNDSLIMEFNIPKEFTLGEAYSLGVWASEMLFKGYETIEVPAGEFHDCHKFVKENVNGDPIKIMHFKKGIGLIRAWDKFDENSPYELQEYNLVND